MIISKRRENTINSAATTSSELTTKSPAKRHCEKRKIAHLGNALQHKRQASKMLQDQVKATKFAQPSRLYNPFMMQNKVLEIIFICLF